MSTMAHSRWDVQRDSWQLCHKLLFSQIAVYLNIVKLYCVRMMSWAPSTSGVPAAEGRAHRGAGGGSQRERSNHCREGDGAGAGGGCTDPPGETGQYYKTYYFRINLWLLNYSMHLQKRWYSTLMFLTQDAQNNSELWCSSQRSLSLCLCGY